MNTKIRFFISIFVAFVTLLGLFGVANPTPVSAMTCDSATFTGTVITGTPPARARFTYGTDYSTVASGGGIPTQVQIFNTDGTFPIEQFISGLSPNTTYYDRLEVTNNYGVKNGSVVSFTTPSCNNPIQTCQDTSAINYGGALPCRYQTLVCQDTTAINYGGTLPCRYQTYYQTCQDTTAINYGGTLPCRYQPYYPPVNNNSLTVITTQATQISERSAQLNSLINSGSTYGYNSPTNAWFEWGTTINLGNKTTTTAVGSLPSVQHADTLTGLNPGTTYYFRAVAENSYQRSVGSILSFCTNGQKIIKYIPVPVKNLSSHVLISSSVDRNQAIVPTIDNTRPHPGDEINYTINYQNVGNASVTNLTLQAFLPKEVDYISSSPNNPNISDNTLLFNLGTLKAEGQGVVTIKVRVKDTAVAGTNLDFPATLSYIDVSGQPQSINTTVSAQVWSSPTSSLGAFAFGAGFFPESIFGWLLLIALILVLIYLVRYLLIQHAATTPAPFIKKTTTTTVDHQQPSTTTTTTIEQ